MGEAEAEAEPGYVYGAYPALYNAYPNWPGVSAPGVSSTCYGCRPHHFYGKRSAEAEADPAHFYGAYGYPYAYRPYYASGYAGPLPGASYQSVHRLHKRSAEAEADPAHFYGAYPYPYGFAPVSYSTHGYGPSGYTIGQGHPGAASSFQSVTRLH